ncbi:MAG: hypothetical protein RL065_1238 [Bacteroidota bacterium]|jgi:hypothetical protein
MYGIINKSIESLVVEKFGLDKWEIIKSKSGINVDFFLSNEAYDDEITYKLVSTIATEMNITVHDVMVTFGEYWVTKTTHQKYESLMNAGGQNLKEFLINLPGFHNRIMLLYPKLTPPEFKIGKIEDDNIEMLYYSKRNALQPFVIGLFQGLGKMFNTKVEVKHIDGIHNGLDHDVYNVKWQK